MQKNHDRIAKEIEKLTVDSMQLAFALGTYSRTNHQSAVAAMNRIEGFLTEASNRLKPLADASETAWQAAIARLRQERQDLEDDIRHNVLNAPAAT